MAKKAMTINQKAFKKELNRINRSIKRAEIRGYDFELPEEIENLLAVPKRVTKSRISKLKEIKIQDLYKYSDYTTPWGESVSGAEGRKFERQVAARKGQQTKVKNQAAQTVSAPNVQEKAQGPEPTDGGESKEKDNGSTSKDNGEIPYISIYECIYNLLSERPDLLEARGILEQNYKKYGNGYLKSLEENFSEIQAAAKNYIAYMEKYEETGNIHSYYAAQYAYDRLILLLNGGAL